jgi:hypothetical protein
MSRRNGQPLIRLGMSQATSIAITQHAVLMASARPILIIFDRTPVKIIRAVGCRGNDHRPGGRCIRLPKRPIHRLYCSLITCCASPLRLAAGVHAPTLNGLAGGGDTDVY